MRDAIAVLDVADLAARHGLEALDRALAHLVQAVQDRASGEARNVGGSRDDRGHLVRNLRGGGRRCGALDHAGLLLLGATAGSDQFLGCVLDLGLGLRVLHDRLGVGLDLGLSGKCSSLGALGGAVLSLGGESSLLLNTGLDERGQLLEPVQVLVGELVIRDGVDGACLLACLRQCSGEVGSREGCQVLRDYEHFALLLGYG